ncbi:MAG: DUF4252 domain-containing protein [Bacteroidetes bacterium]|nr:DUF4252 domain-containing protein [Bacteroidota bacterium]
MKTNRVIVNAFILIMISLSAFSQRNPVDKLFEKYGGKDGFTTILISSKMFSMFSDMEAGDDDINKMIKNIESIKILTTEDESLLDPGINFYKEIMNELSLDEYEELMVVKEKDQDIKFLVKEKEDVIVELLLVIGGERNNALISIRGIIDLKSISKLSKSMNIEGLEKLEEIDKKEQ